MDPLTLRLAQTNDDELWGLLIDALYDVYGYERLLGDEPNVALEEVVALFDVLTTCDGILSDGISRFFTDSSHQTRIISSYTHVGASWAGRLLTSAVRRMSELRRENLTDDQLYDDEKLDSLDSELIRQHKDIQDAVAKFVRSNFLRPEFLGSEIRAYLTTGSQN